MIFLGPLERRSNSMTRYSTFDRGQIELKDLSERGHDLRAADCKPLTAPVPKYVHPELDGLIDAIDNARRRQRPVILMMGAHAIKLGLSRYLIDLIERGIVTHLATNGAGIIHDYELAAGGGTSENVSKWIQRGQFGLWQQTSRINDLVFQGANRGEGLGEAIGRAIEEDQLPFRHLSIAAAGWRCGVPVTSHVGIGSDITHSHPNCDGAAWGAASYTDFLIFAHSVSKLDGGVFLNVGSAVTGPEVYLKALSMARNVAKQRGTRISSLTTAVFDLVELPSNFREGPPAKTHPQYYYRPWKTILVRTVADGGRSYYFCGDLSSTIPTLWQRAAARCSVPGVKAA
jgi:hypothetical protein